VNPYEELTARLAAQPRVWLVTGAAGFIGSNLLEALLRLDQRVIGLDNFSTGRKQSLDEVKGLVSPAQWERFQLQQADIGDLAACRTACTGVDYVLHQAALASVPLSMSDPVRTHRANVTGFLNMLIAARDAKVKRLVYASSSAIYGDDPGLPKIETKVGRLLSPYAATKAINEAYAQTFAMSYGVASIGLRYFNVFGPRQDPEGAYAAVIPKWIAALIKRQPVHINGDGQTSRDFCFVADVVQANLLAATTQIPGAVDGAYNVALGQRTTLNELFLLLQNALRAKDPALPDQQPVYREFRRGDVRHSLADISKARRLLGFAPSHTIASGLEQAMDWYRRSLG
jgi:UDP-N-acetylglucosamine/UDP-N-acetyl-alpha-D-glucosaminouronate 4-epimerase